MPKMKQAYFYGNRRRWGKMLAPVVLGKVIADVAFC